MTEQATVTSYGQVKNHFYNIDPLNGDNRGEDSFIKEIEGAMGGTSAAVIGPNQIIMDTGYQKIESDWNGSHQLFLKFYSNLSTDQKGVIVQYWKKDETGFESNPYNAYPKYKENISSTFGSGIGQASFSESDYYRIKIVTTPDLDQDDWVAVDYITMKQINEFNIGSYYIYGGNTAIVESRLVDTVSLNFTNQSTAQVNYTLPESDWNYLSAFLSVYGGGNNFVTSYAISSDKTTLTVYATYIGGLISGPLSIDMDISIFNSIIEL